MHKKITKSTTIGDYSIELSVDQILVKRGIKKDLVSVKDIKNIGDANDEYNSYVEKFKNSYQIYQAKKLN